MPIPDGAKMIDCPVYSVDKSRPLRENWTTVKKSYLESDNSIKCISERKIGRNMLDNMLPPSGGLESMKNDYCAKINYYWWKYRWFCNRRLRYWKTKMIRYLPWVLIMTRIPRWRCWRIILRILFVRSEEPPLATERYWRDVSWQASLVIEMTNFMSFINHKDFARVKFFACKQPTDNVEDTAGRICVDEGVG